MNEAREYENSKGIGGRSRGAAGEGQDSNNKNNSAAGGRCNARQQSSGSSETSTDGFERNTGNGSGDKVSFREGTSPTLLLQDTLSPLLGEVDALFERSKQIVASLNAQGNRMQEDDVSFASRCRRRDTQRSSQPSNLKLSRRSAARRPPRHSVSARTCCVLSRLPQVRTLGRSMSVDSSSSSRCLDPTTLFLRLTHVCSFCWT